MPCCCWYLIPNRSQSSKKRGVAEVQQVSQPEDSHGLTSPSRTVVAWHLSCTTLTQLPTIRTSGLSGTRGADSTSGYATPCCHMKAQSSWKLCSSAITELGSCLERLLADVSYRRATSDSTSETAEFDDSLSLVCDSTAPAECNIPGPISCKRLCIWRSSVGTPLTSVSRMLRREGV